jgi:2-desacetyl-2-hydroxyethyl bacteriochlorophyllide A dehydrogenase
MSQSAYVITGERTLSVVEVEEILDPEPGHVLVELAFTGVCASDVDAYRKGYPYHPTLSGHEWAGVVVRVGDGVTDVAVGDRVARTSLPGCGECPMCRAGHHGNCFYFSLSSQPNPPKHGGYARRIQVPQRGVVKLPQSVTLEQGALIEPAAVALHGVNRAQPRLGDTVVVIGVGVIGLFAVQFAKLSGATRVFAVDPDPARRSVALEVGAFAAFDPEDATLARIIREETGGRGADIAYDCSGHPAALKQGVALLRLGATFMMIGSSSTPIEIVPAALWNGMEIDVRGSLAHNREEFDTLVDLLDRGLVRTPGMTDTVVALSGLPKTFEEMAARPLGLKVLVDTSL